MTTNYQVKLTQLPDGNFECPILETQSQSEAFHRAKKTRRLRSSYYTHVVVLLNGENVYCKRIGLTKRINPLKF